MKKRKQEGSKKGGSEEKREGKKRGRKGGREIGGREESIVMVTAQLRHSFLRYFSSVH